MGGGRPCAPPDRPLDRGPRSSKPRFNFNISCMHRGDGSTARMLRGDGGGCAAVWRISR
jgi:hypothetical protein